MPACPVGLPPLQFAGAGALLFSRSQKPPGQPQHITKQEYRRSAYASRSSGGEQHNRRGTPRPRIFCHNSAAAAGRGASQSLGDSAGSFGGSAESFGTSAMSFGGSAESFRPPAKPLGGSAGSF